MEKHNYRNLIRIFDGLFEGRYETVLVAGDAEPIYLAKSESSPLHRIVFAHGYFASALHEVAHWSLAGSQRRLVDDFGYWYQPDGRSEAQQRLFEQVEVRPQALEWIYTKACGRSFQFSADNLDGTVGDMLPFQLKVRTQVHAWLEQGLPNRRAKLLVKALRAFYATEPLVPEMFEVADRALALG